MRYVGILELLVAMHCQADLDASHLSMCFSLLPLSAVAMERDGLIIKAEDPYMIVSADLVR